MDEELPLELSCIDIRSVTPPAVSKKKKKVVDHRIHNSAGGTFIELHPYTGQVSHNNVMNDSFRRSPLSNDDKVLAVNDDVT